MYNVSVRRYIYILARIFPIIIFDLSVPVLATIPPTSRNGRIAAYSPFYLSSVPPRARKGSGDGTRAYSRQDGKMVTFQYCEYL